MNDRLRRLIRRAAWGLIVLLLVGIVVWTTVNVIGASRFESALIALKEAGYVTSPEALAPPAPPVNQNSAPMFTAAFALFVEPQAGEVTWYPDPRDPDGPQEAPTAEAKARQDQWVRTNADAFDLVRRARKRPQCLFERDYRQGFSMLLPELAKVLSMTQALQVLAGVKAKTGDLEAAREDVSSLFSLGESLRGDHVLVSQLIRYLAWNRGCDAIQSCITAETAEADLKAWRAQLPDESRLDGSLELAYRGELVIAAELVARPPEVYWSAVGLKGALGLHLLLAPLLKSDGARYLAILPWMVEVARKPYPEARTEAEALEAENRRSWTRPVCNFLLPSLVRSLEGYRAAQATVAVARAGIDAELEFRATGRYPEMIRATDPFTGKPLDYDPKGGTISSAGGRDVRHRIEWKLRGIKK